GVAAVGGIGVIGEILDVPVGVECAVVRIIPADLDHVCCMSGRADAGGVKVGLQSALLDRESGNRPIGGGRGRWREAPGVIIGSAGAVIGIAGGTARTVTQARRTVLP